MTIYVVDGCDASGKTTFMNHLSELTNYPIYKGSSFEIAAFGVEEMFNFMLSQLNSKENIILDRSFISNLVYGPKYDRNTLTFHQVEILLDKFVENAMLIYFVAPLEVLEKRLEKRGDDKIKKEDLFEILKTYDAKLYQMKLLNHKFTYLQFDTSLFNSNEYAEMFYNTIKKKESK